MRTPRTGPTPALPRIRRYPVRRRLPDPIPLDAGFMVPAPVCPATRSHSAPVSGPGSGLPGDPIPLGAGFMVPAPTYVGAQSIRPALSQQSGADRAVTAIEGRAWAAHTAERAGTLKPHRADDATGWRPTALGPVSPRAGSVTLPRLRQPNPGRPGLTRRPRGRGAAGSHRTPTASR